MDYRRRNVRTTTQDIANLQERKVDAKITTPKMYAKLQNVEIKHVQIDTPKYADSKKNDTLKDENHIKINNLVKVQLAELDKIRNGNVKLIQCSQLTKESFNVALVSKDEELKEVNKSYMKELQDLKKVIAEKEIKLTDSFILNTKYEHQIINFKEKHTEIEVNYDKLSVGEDLKKKQ